MAAPPSQPLAFWLGTWVVEDRETGALAGRNEIASILDGNAVVESWHGAGGLDGASLFYYDRAADTWRQVWATSAGYAKQKTLVAAESEGEVRFEGVVSLPDGSRVRDRTTLSPLEGGSVRQVIETAALDGEAWTVGFDAVYRRA